MRKSHSESYKTLCHTESHRFSTHFKISHTVGTNQICKPDKLSVDERVFVESHPSIGFRLVKDAVIPDLVKDIIRLHHEKIDKEIHKFAETPTLFAQQTQPIGKDFIIVPIVSSSRRRYIPKNVPKVPYVASSDVVRFEDYFKQVIRYAVSHGKDIQLTGNFARDFCYQGDYNMANLIKVVEQYRSAVQIPDRLFFNSQESYMSFIASALNGMEYYIGVVTMFSFKKVALSQNSKNIILAFASNSEIRGWSVAPVKSAKLVHFTADGQEVVKDISSSIWR